MRKFLFPLTCLLVCILPILLVSCGKTCKHTNQTTEEIPPICDKEGYTLHVCQDCKEEYKTDRTPPLGHSLTENKVEPTCTAEGYTEYSCDCGYIYKGSFCPPKGHSYENEAMAPTCEQDGHVISTCSVCEHRVKSEILSAKGHTLTKEIHAPTCTEAGYTLYSCEACDLTYIADRTSPTGHSMRTTYILHPSPSEQGVIRQHCSNCQHEFTNHLLYHDLYTNAYVSQTKILAKGIDVSYWNNSPKSADGALYESLNWEVIQAAGFEFAILRAGYTGTKDVTFEMNYADAKAAGMDLGAYYYSYAKTAEQAIEEANELLSWLDGKQFEYPIYFDMEDDSCLLTPDGSEETPSERKERLTATCIAFIRTLREAGYYGALYSNNSWLTNYLDADLLKEYGELWYARYPEDPYQKQGMSDEEFAAIEAAHKILPSDNFFIWDTQKYGAQVGLWQYTQHGVIEGSGMDQKVDFNYAFKDYPALMKTYGLNGYRAIP